jgi:hypothetical protein
LRRKRKIVMLASTAIPVKTPMTMPAIAPPERPLARGDEDREDAVMEGVWAEDNDEDEDPAADVADGLEELADVVETITIVEKAVGVAPGIDVPIADDGSALYSFSRAFAGETPAFGFANSLMQTFI